MCQCVKIRCFSSLKNAHKKGSIFCLKIYVFLSLVNFFLTVWHRGGIIYNILRGVHTMKVSIYFHDDMYNRICDEASKQNMNVSKFVQLAVEHEFNTIDGEKAIDELFSVNSEEILAAFKTLGELNNKIKIVRTQEPPKNE